MEGKTVIITGANGGIGFQTTKKIAEMGARVIMACRNLKSAQTAKEEILKSNPNAILIIKKLDTSDIAIVREFAQNILDNEARLDVLIHNAGIGGGIVATKTTRDGLNEIMATNHFGSFLLTHLLIDLLKKSAPSRIVFVSSKLYFCASCNASNCNSYNLPYFLYCRSKRANMMFAMELAKRLKGTGVTANFLHPGVIDSGIWNKVPFPASLLFDGMRHFMKTVEEGCRTTVYVATNPALEQITGKYFRDEKLADLKCIKSFNEKENEEFFEISKKLVGLRVTDPKI